VKPLSEQLLDLSQRAKKIEDSAAATRQKNQAELQRRHDQLKADIESTGKKLESSAAEAKADVRSGWADIKRRIDERLATAHAKIQERKAERDVNRAESLAKAAENDAAEAIALAVYVLDQAEFAVVTAALDRAVADSLRAAA